MDDERNIGLVDTHAERIGCDHNGLAVVEKIVLVLRPFHVRKSGVIACGIESGITERCTDLFHRLSGGAVDNAAFSVVFFQQVKQFRHFAVGTAYSEKQVFPVESGMYGLRVTELQYACNIRLDLLGCRRRKRRADRTHRQLFHKHRNVQIALPEILSPLGDAVRLIHSDHADLHPLRQPEQTLRHQPFRCHIENAALSLL